MAIALWACNSEAPVPAGFGGNDGNPVAVDAGVGGDATSSDAAGGRDSASNGEGGATDASPGGEGGVHDAGSGAIILFSPYKDTGVNLDGTALVASTLLPGSSTPIAQDLVAHGATTITLAFATGACGSENWAGVAGDALAAANVPLLTKAGVKFVVSTGGAGGAFTCTSDPKFETFLGRWASPGLLGVDFDIESGQTQSDVTAIVTRIRTARAAHPALRFSLTLPTNAANAGAMTAQSLGAAAPDPFSTYGDDAMAAVESLLGFAGTDATWPPYLAVNLMAMDYGSADPSDCVVGGGACQMGQSALQAAYDLHDKWRVPWSAIELTVMLGGNDTKGEKTTLQDVDTIAAFARAQGLAGVHYWSYDRDTDCPSGTASSTCNSMGNGYAGNYGYLARFLADGLR